MQVKKPIRELYQLGQEQELGVGWEGSHGDLFRPDDLFRGDHEAVRSEIGGGAGFKGQLSPVMGGRQLLHGPRDLGRAGSHSSSVRRPEFQGLSCLDPGIFYIPPDRGSQTHKTLAQVLRADCGGFSSLTASRRLKPSPHRTSLCTLTAGAGLAGGERLGLQLQGCFARCPGFRTLILNMVKIKPQTIHP